MESEEGEKGWKVEGGRREEGKKGRREGKEGKRKGEGKKGRGEVEIEGPEKEEKDGNEKKGMR